MQTDISEIVTQHGTECIRDLYDRTKKIIMKDTGMKFYDASRLLYLETDALGVDLRARLLH